MADKIFKWVWLCKDLLIIIKFYISLNNNRSMCWNAIKNRLLKYWYVKSNTVTESIYRLECSLPVNNPIAILAAIECYT